MWADEQLLYKIKWWGVEHRWDGYHTRGNRKVYRPIERMPMSRGWQYVQPGPDTRHPHIKKRKLEDVKNEEDPKTYQVQNEPRKRRKRVAWLET